MHLSNKYLHNKHCPRCLTLKKRMKLCGTEVLKKLGENKISRKDSVVSPEYRKVISSSKKKENR